ncbi:MAG: hypothetical protein NWE99_06355 [Candidatus Bathyarchaeota archaeon]|nr:hypothetical protein [Candidatus Bathyarchaeota archaeon]
MDRKLIVLASLCIVFIISTASSIIYYSSILGDKNRQISSLQEEIAPLNAQVDSLNTTIQQQNKEIAQKNEALDSLNSKIIELNNQIANLTSQISSLNSQINSLNRQAAAQSKLVIDSITVTDERSSTPYSLHIACRVNNTGTGIAYNALIHTTATSADGMVIDDYHPFGEITGGGSLLLDFKINYTGSPIRGWTVSPMWTSQPPTISIGTFP